MVIAINRVEKSPQNPLWQQARRDEQAACDRYFLKLIQGQNSCAHAESVEGRQTRTGFVLICRSCRMKFWEDTSGYSPITDDQLSALLSGDWLKKSIASHEHS